MLNPWRHELPAYSPISAYALWRSGVGRLRHAARELERARKLVADQYSADRVELVDSGRSALTLAILIALARAGGGRRRIVAIPAFQCYEVATAAVGADCDIVLYDIEPATLTPDLASLERALAAGASAVVVASLYGLPVDWQAIESLTRRHGAVAVEDAAQAHGAKWRNRSLGALGELSVLSFGRGKGWTGGGGGALLMRGEVAQSHHEPLSRLHLPGGGRELRLVANTLVQLAFGRPGLYGLPAGIPALALGQTIYHEPTTPTRATRFSAALLGRMSDVAAREALGRRDNAARWIAELPGRATQAIPPVLAGGIAGYLRFPIHVPAGIAADLESSRYRRAGIARSYPKPLSELPAVAARMLGGEKRFPGAEQLARTLVTLPTHTRLTDRGREAILALASSWNGGIST